MRAFFTRAALVLALLQGSCLLRCVRDLVQTSSSHIDRDDFRLNLSSHTYKPTQSYPKPPVDHARTAPHSSAQMDQGDMIVNAVKESIQNGEDWHRALEAQEGPEAVASHKVRSAGKRRIRCCPRRSIDRSPC